MFSAFTYRFGNTVVASDQPLPELHEASSGMPSCVVRFAPDRRSTVETSLTRWNKRWHLPDGRVSLAVGRRDDLFVLDFPGSAMFEVAADSSEIRCYPEAGAEPTTLRHLLLDQVLPRVLSLRGRLVLHAGAVGTPKGAVAFVGETGWGKSTLCASFAGAGYSMLSDDGLILGNMEDTRVAVIAGYPGLRLLPESARAFESWSSRLGSRPADTDGAANVASYSEKQRVRRDRVSFVTKAVPLTALFVLSPPESAVALEFVDVNPLSPRDAFMALVKHSFQLDLDAPTRQREFFSRVGDYVSSIPMYRLSYTRSYVLLPAVRHAALSAVASESEETWSTLASSRFHQQEPGSAFDLDP